MDTKGKFQSSMKISSKMRHGFPTVILLFCLVSAMIQVGEAVWLDIPPTGTKCVSEEIHSNVVVMGDYIIISEDLDALPTISVKVTSPYGNVLQHVENVTHGHFAFTTKASGNYLACFWADARSHGNKNISINIDWKTGIAAKDWDTIAKKEKIQGLELEIRKLDGVVEAIHENLIYLKNREAEMRIVNEKTNSHVAWYSIMSLGICIVVSCIQVVYLKQYFERKKII